MKRINLTEIAELNRTPISQIDTYGQIPKEKIQDTGSNREKSAYTV